VRKNGVRKNGVAKLEKLVRNLVANDQKAADWESGMCRFCHARIEAFEDQNLEGHRPHCPWHQVRSELGLTA